MAIGCAFLVPVFHVVVEFRHRNITTFGKIWEPVRWMDATDHILPAS